ncbi:hypothetical protein BS78_03G253900 [Paspalum vaginatum]|nr:hypothetical protein BS78_03G253900 [Paspalum vaginatum]
MDVKKVSYIWQHPEIAHHLIIGCRYSRRIWEALASWLSVGSLDLASWPVSNTVKQWWFTVGSSAGPKRGSRSLLLERNARTFQNRERLVPDLLVAIKAEARLWCLDGAKHLLALLPSSIFT